MWQTLFHKLALDADSKHTMCIWSGMSTQTLQTTSSVVHTLHILWAAELQMTVW